MPFVQIDLPEGSTSERIRHIGDAIHDAMVATIDIPQDDRFQIIAERPAPLRVFDRSYLGVPRSDACIFVQITLRSGRRPAQKRALYRRIADNLATNAGVLPGDVMIVLRENEPVDWSFGNGEAQIAPEAGET
jgi:phenylpyruvate tautomerase PptA (4-oxalocrotonate tautomerase family)